MLHRLRFKIFMLSGLFTVIVLIAIGVLLSGCAPAGYSSSVVIAGQQETVKFFSEGSLHCAAIQSPSGALRELTCTVVK